MPPRLHRYAGASLLALAAALALYQAEASAKEGRMARVVTGSVTVSGWEQQLIRGNPNLRHFYWSSITSNVQGRHKVSEIHGPNIKHVKFIPARPRKKPVYVRPVHIPTIAGRPSSYSGKPVHIPITRKKETSASIRSPEVSSRVATKAVNGQLKSKTVQANLRRPKKSSAIQTATALRLTAPDLHGTAFYPDRYDAHPTLGAAQTYGQLESKDVYGQITSGARPF